MNSHGKNSMTTHNLCKFVFKHHNEQTINTFSIPDYYSCIMTTVLCFRIKG